MALGPTRPHAMVPMLRFTSSILALVVAATAQQSFTERMNARFEKKPPLVGDTLPDASGFTADGKPFTLASDRGKLTVLVFGCLT